MSWLGRLRNVKDGKEFILLCTFCGTYYLFYRAFLFECVPCGFVPRGRQRDIRNFPPLVSAMIIYRRSGFECNDIVTMLYPLRKSIAAD